MISRRFALVTGATSGIGRACALHLDSLGWTVCGIGRDTKRLQSLASSFRSTDSSSSHSFVLQCDLVDTKERELEELFASGRVWDALDSSETFALVHAAGISLNRLWIRSTAEDMQKLFDINVFAADRLSRLVVRRVLRHNSRAQPVSSGTECTTSMKASIPKGSIVFLSSIVGDRGNIGQTVYGATKQALIGLASSMAVELGPRQIRVNVVSPGFISSRMTETLVSKEMMSAVREKTPLRRIGDPQDVAHLVSFLVSDDASFVTGSVFPIDGGLHTCLST